MKQELKWNYLARNIIYFITSKVIVITTTPSGFTSQLWLMGKIFLFTPQRLHNSYQSLLGMSFSLLGPFKPGPHAQLSQTYCNVGSLVIYSKSLLRGPHTLSISGLTNAEVRHMLFFISTSKYERRAFFFFFSDLTHHVFPFFLLF